MIGAILDLGADAGPDGLQRYEAAKLAVELVNRRGGVRLSGGQQRTLDLVVYDGAGQPEQARAAVSRLAQDGVLAIVGPTDAESSVAARRTAETAGLPLIALDDQGGGEGGAWRWTFSLAAPPEETLAAGLDFFMAIGVSRIGWLAPLTMEASTLRRVLFRLAAGANIQVAAEELYPPGQNDFAGALARLQATDPQVILAWPRDSHDAATIARDAGKLPVLAPIYFGLSASGPTTLAQAGDGAPVVRTLTPRLAVADDLWDHDALTPIVRDFRREIQLRTGRPPTAEAAGAWDAVRLIVRTIEQTQPTRFALRDALEATTDYPGVTGAITFGARRHDALDRRAYVVARSEGRRWRLPP